MKRHKLLSVLKLLFLIFAFSFSGRLRGSEAATTTPGGGGLGKADVTSLGPPVHDDGPLLLVKPDSSIVVAESRVSFFCRADGNPIPTVTWRKNGNLIADSRYTTKTLTNGLSTLRIEPVRMEDSNSTISCTGDNGVGSPIKAEAKLTVLSQESLPKGFPVIEAHPILKSVEQGRTAYITCRVQGEPRPKVLWLRDLMPLDVRSNSRYSVSTLGNPGALMIQQSREDDQGKYECVARNEHGVMHSKSAHIYVKVRRVPPYFTFKFQKLYRVGIGSNLNITCIAVGYPMPRVFWKRQSDDSYLSDPQTAPVGKNILVLTDIQEPSENYTCIAVSKLGNIEMSTMVEARELLPAPRGLAVFEINETTVRIKWNTVQSTSAEDGVTAYIVKYRQKYAERGGNWKEFKVNASHTSATVEKLSPYQHYEFVVQAVNSIGRGRATHPVEAQTAESLPANPPSDVKARPLNSFSILTQWSPPDSPNGRITGYRVFYTNDPRADDSDKSQWQVKETQADEQMATLSGLTPDKTYIIQVQAVNSKGQGPLSRSVTVITKQGVPGQPAHLAAKAVDARRIQLTWQKPLHSYNIVGYTIRFNASRNEVKEITLTSDVQRHTIDGLRPDTVYVFRVAANSDRGQGAYGDEVAARTLPSDAIVFPDFNFLPGNSSTFLKATISSSFNFAAQLFLEYRTLFRATPVSSYEDEDEEDFEGSAVMPPPPTPAPWHRISFEDRVAEVGGLIPNTVYESRLVAVNENGTTTDAVKLTAKTLEDVPSAPRELEIIQVNASTVKLTWDRPEHENGELIGYYVFKEKLVNGEPVDNHVQHELVIADPNKLYAMIAGLEPNTEYAFRVCAFNLHGDGERTPAKKMMTGGMPPSSPRPQAVSMVSEDPPLKARIDWLPPDVTYNQPVNAYVVFYRPVDSLAIDDYERLEVPGTQTFAELTKLYMGREYEIRVAAGNDDGWSVNATERLITPVGVPDGEPLNVRYDIVAGQLTMQWDPPGIDKRNGNISYYRAILTPLDGKSSRIDKQVHSRSHTYKINSKSGYTFKVAAATMKGEGPYSPVLTVSPFESAIVGPPSNVRVQATSNSSAVIQWDFDEGAGASDGFIVKYIHEPTPGNEDTSNWRSQTVMDPKARHLEIVRLNSHKPYAFCVLSIKASRLGQCSDPPITIDRLLPVHMVSNLHIQYKTSQSVSLKWDYDGPQPIRFYVKQSGQKVYLNQDLVEKRLVAPGFENKVDGNERSFMWQNLRQYMDYTFQVGVVSLHDGTIYWPKEVKVRTDPTGPPFVDTPEFIDSRAAGTAQIRLRCASEEYGPILHYWIIVVPGNYSKDDVLNIDSSQLEKATMAMQPKISITAATAKKVKKAIAGSDEDDDEDEEIITEKVKRALENEIIEAAEYLEDELALDKDSDLDSGIESDSSRLVKSHSISQTGKITKKSKRSVKTRSKRYFHEVDRHLEGIYITAKLEAQQMRQFVHDEQSFTLGDGKDYNGYLNHPLDPNFKYSLMMRAFAKGDTAPKQGSLMRAPMAEPAAKLFTDSMLSEPFSTKNAAFTTKGKGLNIWFVAPVVIIFVVLFLLGILIYWFLKKGHKGQRGMRHGSITKVALPGSGFGNGNGIHESSKLLTDVYGRPTPQMDTSMVDMYPTLVNGGTLGNGTMPNGISGTLNYPTVQLPLPIHSSTTTAGVPRGAIQLPDLATHIDRLKMNNNALFTQEFECIDGGQHFTWDASNLEVNKPKNRYANVVAYDHTRVCLNPIDGIPGSDYINANFVDGFGKMRAYIATQGPLPETFADFWRMVWEQQSQVIVMLTRLEERARIKCDQYWPAKGAATYGNITVGLLETVELAHYTIRTFRIENVIENQYRTVVQLQYTAWPDHGVPDHPTPFLMFLKRVKNMNLGPNAGPIISHCSAGIGRTGAFIAIDCMLERMRHENTVDIYECVTQLRAQRSYMVQTDDQYIFIHDAVLDAAQSGSTEVPADKLYQHMQRLTQVQHMNENSDMEMEFSILSTLKALNSRCHAANLPVNRSKNRHPNVVPFDTTRVILETIASIEGSDYINASWVDGYRQRGAYIATQAPLKNNNVNTIADFWRMVWEKDVCIIVMLTHLREHDRDPIVEYWPTETMVYFDSIAVEPVAEYIVDYYLMREFKVIDCQTKQSRTVRHFHYLEWPDFGVPKTAEGFNEFVEQVHTAKGVMGKDGPICVHCTNGAGRTGVFIALATIIERMKLEHVVDVFTTIKLLRTERQNMIESKDEYQFVYQAALEYLAAHYDNELPFP